MHREDRPFPCKGKHALFFSERSIDERRAVALCKPCPERVACLTGARERQEPYGTWGAETKRQRFRAINGRTIRKAAVDTVNPTTPAIKADIVRLNEQGMSRLAISQELNITKDQVIGVLRRMRGKTDG
jgi:hypothetical protein